VLVYVTDGIHIVFQEFAPSPLNLPPAVGNALNISARLAARLKLQIPAVTKPHITAMGPPEGSANDNDAANAVQEFKIANDRPSIVLGSIARPVSKCLNLVRQGGFLLKSILTSG